MRTIEKYQTKDGKIHSSKSEAENHAFAGAVDLLRDSLFEVYPGIIDPYGVSNRLIRFFIEHRKILQSIVEWIEDIDSESE